MLKSILIKNVQCYPKLKIKFSPGLNVIIGESGTGKTTIFRSIQWPYNNEPTGDEFKEQFLRDGEKEAKVILNWDDCKVGRVRANNKNVYLLNERKLNAVGKGKIPEEILNALRLHDINFQSFTDPNFLFALKDGEVAKYLNKIADMEGIDSSQSSIKKEKLEVDRQIREIEKQLLEKKEKLESYKWIEKIEPQVVTLYQQEKEIKKEQRRIDNINKLLFKLKKVKKQKQEIQINPNIKNLITNLEEKIIYIEKQKNKISIIKNLLDKINSKKVKYKKVKKEFLLLKKKFKKLMPAICPLCGKGD